MKKSFIALFAVSVLTLQGCSGFKAERLSTAEGDAKAMEITDEWLLTDTQNTIKEIMQKMDSNRGFQRYLNNLGHRPKVFIAEVQNETSEAYFPIDDMNDEFLQQISETGDFRLIDAAARDRILKEIRYQNEGMVKTSDIRKIGKQTGAELLIFGAVRMNPKTLNGIPKTPTFETIMQVYPISLAINMVLIFSALMITRPAKRYGHVVLES